MISMVLVVVTFVTGTICAVVGGDFLWLVANIVLFVVSCATGNDICAVGGDLCDCF